MVLKFLSILLAGLVATWAGFGCSKSDPEGPFSMKLASLDQLDPSQIPATERLAFQPKELVGVLRAFDGTRDGWGCWAVFSPDGRWLATSGTDRIVRLWSVATLKQVAALEGHANDVLALAFAPNSEKLASAGLDKTVRIWDVSGEKPRERNTLIGHKGNIWGVAISADSRVVASAGGADGSARLWDLRGDRQRLQTIVVADTRDAYSVAFCPKGKFLAAAGTDGIVRLYTLGAKEPQGPYLLKGHSAVYPLAFSPDGKLLASADHAGGEGTVRLWDVTGTQPQIRSRLTSDSNGYATLSFSPDGKLLAAASHGDKKVIVWEVAKGKVLHNWQFPHFIGGVSFAPDGRHLAAASSRGAVYILRLPR